MCNAGANKMPFGSYIGTAIWAWKVIVTLGFLAWTSYNVLEGPSEANLRSNGALTCWPLDANAQKMAIATSKQQSPSSVFKVHRLCAVYLELRSTPDPCFVLRCLLYGILSKLFLHNICLVKQLHSFCIKETPRCTTFVGATVGAWIFIQSTTGLEQLQKS